MKKNWCGVFQLPNQNSGGASYRVGIPSLTVSSPGLRPTGQPADGHTGQLEAGRAAHLCACRAPDGFRAKQTKHSMERGRRPQQRRRAGPGGGGGEGQCVCQRNTRCRVQKVSFLCWPSVHSGPGYTPDGCYIVLRISARKYCDCNFSSIEGISGSAVIVLVIMLHEGLPVVVLPEYPHVCHHSHHGAAHLNDTTHGNL